jgi:hypothetical protein
MNTYAPFKILSVSAPLHFGKHSGLSSTLPPQRCQTPANLLYLVMFVGSVESDRQVVFSVSMAFFPTEKAAVKGKSPWRKSGDVPGGYLNHGWLDDTLVVGAGLRDEKYNSIHLPVDTSLRGHKLCP